MRSPSLLPAIVEYLAVRRDLGFDLKPSRWLLVNFARYADRIEHRGPVTVDLAVRWALSSGSSPSQAARRLSAVRGFARHQVAMDPATEVPAPGLLGHPPVRRKQPHIYSGEEIAALLRECSLLHPQNRLRPKTYVAFFSLLACTGLRLSEACRLTHRDVDLYEALLTIRESKFRKSRLVPLHPSAAKALTGYATQRDAFRYAPRSELFFRTDEAACLTLAAVEKTFSRLRARLGWTAHGRARRPHIHDLRHTFAVRRLLRWYEEGADVDGKVLALATYLGHAKITDTYWYLSAIPELMAVTSQRFEHFVRHTQESAS
jgi:integrase